MTNGDIKIDDSSLQYILGRIDQRLQNGDKVMEKLTKAIDSLPCGKNDMRLKHLEEEVDCLQDGQTFRQRAGLKLWHGVIIAVVTAALSAGVTLLSTGGI